MFENLMLGDVRARKYSKTGARTRSILEKFAFDTTLLSMAPETLKARVIILWKNRSFWPYLYYNFFVSNFHWKYINYKDIGPPGYIE